MKSIPQMLLDLFFPPLISFCDFHCGLCLWHKGENLFIDRRHTHRVKEEEELLLKLEGERNDPTTNDGMQNGSSVGTVYIHITWYTFLHALRRFVCLVTKFPHRKLNKSALLVGEGLLTAPLPPVIKASISLLFGEEIPSGNFLFFCKCDLKKRRGFYLSDLCLGKGETEMSCTDPKTQNFFFHVATAKKNYVILTT